MSDYHTKTLNAALRLLSDSSFLPVAVKHLSNNVDAINKELGEAVLAEIPAFSESNNPEILPDLARHGPEHTVEILRLLGGGSVGDFKFVQEHARRRAEQRFPLETTLHAYRCGHKVFSRWMREATLTAASSPKDATANVAAVADFTMEYTDTISTIFASTYLAQSRLLADVEGDQRAELLTILLDGYDESDGRVAKILRNAGYLDRRQSFCVVLAQSVDPAEMLNPNRARRLADAIDKALQRSAARRLIDIRNNKVTMVFSGVRRVSGWTAPHTELAKGIKTKLSMIGNAVLIGISDDVPSTSRIPTAHKEALLALELANVSHRVVQFSEIPTQRLMLHLAGEEFQRALPPWSDEFYVADDKAKGVLIATLRAYANANMNVLKAAENLSVHANTIYSRLRKIYDITHLDAKSFHPLTELLIVADCRHHSADRHIRED
ncbi:MAG: helix-turn-helix domain-containing protein [Gammaproteobacteria bacterium]|nr:helix-turn-helix domain-containing protein [Gammaproteobacteria bacterium]